MLGDKCLWVHRLTCHDLIYWYSKKKNLAVLRGSCFCVFQIEALKQMTRDELVSWFHEHRGQNSRKLSMHVGNVLMRVCLGIYLFPLLISASLSLKGCRIWC